MVSIDGPNILYFLKDPGPLNSKKRISAAKTHFSGLTTQYAPRLNQGPSAAKKHDSGWVLAWIFPFNFRGFLITHLRSETMYTLLFADFLIHIARGKLMKFLPAIVPIPGRFFS